MKPPEKSAGSSGAGDLTISRLSICELGRTSNENARVDPYVVVALGQSADDDELVVDDRNARDAADYFRSVLVLSAGDRLGRYAAGDVTGRSHLRDQSRVAVDLARRDDHGSVELRRFGLERYAQLARFVPAQLERFAAESFVADERHRDNGRSGFGAENQKFAFGVGDRSERRSFDGDRRSDDRGARYIDNGAAHDGRSGLGVGPCREGKHAQHEKERCQSGHELIEAYWFSMPQSYRSLRYGWLTYRDQTVKFKLRTGLHVKRMLRGKRPAHAQFFLQSRG